MKTKHRGHCQLRLIIPIVILLVAVTVAVLICEPQILYVAGERLMPRTSKIKTEAVTDIDARRIPLEELREDSRVVFDQSMMLVNTDHALPDDFTSDVSEYNDSGVTMNNCMHRAYEELSGKVYEEFGTKLYISSSFRTKEEQEVLYLEDPSTATSVGASEHQSGLALDVYVLYYAGDAFIKSPAGRYVNSHSWEYGFIIRYPSYGKSSTGIRFEPWHIRYVGMPHAAVIYNNRMTLEKYIESLQIGQWYRICGYCVSRQSAHDGYLSMPYEYTSCVISSDNTGCYIITLE